jgi:drug/metabolite transporter (DMT)-like permease
MLAQRILSYLLVGALWGITNPFIKRAKENSGKRDYSDSEKSPLETVIELLTNPAQLIPFAINQSGSLFFYYLLANDPLTVAGPLCNALTFAFTAITAFLLGEQVRSPILLALGTLLVLLGVYLCCL